MALFSYVYSSVHLTGFEYFCTVMGQVTKSFINYNSRSYPGSALVFIGRIIVIPLTVSVSLTLSIGTVDVVRTTYVIVPLSVIDVKSIGTVADVRATEDVDAAASSMLIVPLRICRYLPVA